MHLSNKNVAKIFLQNAESEGFRFGNGKKPTKRKWDDIYALNKDFTINYVGYIGHNAFHHPNYFDNDKLIRIDYSAYLSGAENYIIEK